MSRDHSVVSSKSGTKSVLLKEDTASVINHAKRMLNDPKTGASPTIDLDSIPETKPTALFKCVHCSYTLFNDLTVFTHERERKI